jgi:hypothetical protein
MRKKAASKRKAEPTPATKMAKAPTPKEIAEWMVAQVETKDELYQYRAVAQIKRRFGEEFFYPGDCDLPPALVPRQGS